MTSKIYKCSFCEYESYKKFNFNRHMMSKHKKNIYKNLNPDNKNLNPDNKNLNLDNKNLNLDNKCSKCNKILSSKQYLKKHLLICKGVSNILECHICHNIFSCHASKSVKKNHYN